MKILFLSSNPHQDLQLDEEYRAVQGALEDHKDTIELIYKSAVRIDDLIKAINLHKPNVVHFTGHGNKNGELLFTDKSGHYDELISANSLKKLFSTEKNSIFLVFLNACYSITLAKTINEEIDYTIGMNGQIKKAAATALAKTFYSSFVSGRTIKESFKQAIVKLESSYTKESSIPKLLINKNINFKYSEVITLNKFQKVEEYITNNKLHEAIELLIKLARFFNNTNLINEALLHKSNLNSINNEIRLYGKNNDTDTQLKYLKNSLLEFLSILKDYER